MAVDPILLLARALTQKGNVKQSDLSALLSPELGFLTGTYTQDPMAGAVDEELLFQQYAPNMRLALAPNVPDDDIRKRIVTEISYYGMAPWDVKRQIEEYTAKQAELNPGVYNEEGETKDLLSFADTVFRENNDLQVQKAKSSGDTGSQWAKITGGLPTPDVRYAPEDLLPEFFGKYATETQERQKRLESLKQGSKAREAALKFLGDQSGQFDASRQALPTYETPGYFESDRRTKEGLKSTSKEVQRLQSDYQDAMKTLATLRSGGRVPGLSEMGKDNAIAAAQRRVDATKKLFEDKFASAKERGMYGPAMMSGSVGGDIETRRFRGVAGRVAQRPDSSKERQRIVQEQKVADIVAQRVAEGVAKKAEEAGLTPFMAALLQRSQFLNAGGG